MWKRVAALGSAVALASLALASPALAGSCGTACAVATVTIPSSITISGVSDIPLTYNANGTATGSETYSVVTNGPYTLDLMSPSGSFTGAGILADSNQLTVTENTNTSGNVTNPSFAQGPNWDNTTGGTIQIDNNTSGTGASYSETWKLSGLNNAPAGSYTQDFTYMATAG